ncbi:malate synthase G [Salisediminibacterium beveridgei]|uniref:Malate synthase G n=1 Tax=Salisediminibacterium beveridgei TaxID=632773 RepID=A0A1D7QWG2_9BACI|nr:malate synthase G [Salisediminibacterium beveridgei]AOM83354.1 Malate synthase G [Salisediminibacterium beveridgei]
MTYHYKKLGSLNVEKEFASWVDKLLITAGINNDTFWSRVEAYLNKHHDINENLLKKRDDIQLMHDQLTLNECLDLEQYQHFLKEAGYLEEERSKSKVETNQLDDEITSQAGPQLVVPVNNARYALNAANARWGSLYDSLYGTDVIDEDHGKEKTSSYNPLRGSAVIEYSKALLDEWVPLVTGSHQEAEEYVIDNKMLKVKVKDSWTELASSLQFKGYRGDPQSPESILIEHHRMHLDILIDRTHPIGKNDKAGVKDIELEAATTVIADFEDSVAAVDPEDKLDVYHHWHQLIEGSLTTEFTKGGRTVTRKLNEDRVYQAQDNTTFSLSGRSLLLVRNVGHLMKTDLITFADGSHTFEGMIDGIISGLIGKLDHQGKGTHTNSDKGSIYIVKPKMHGSEEVKFANSMFTDIEEILDLPANTIKIGVMDEERRTSLNLKNCIDEVRNRIFFINTGFLDRTGDEIHTAFQIGPMIRKGAMKDSVWLTGYEQSNVFNGLQTGLNHKGQIGKGMWAMPDEMKKMVDQKIGHLYAGGNTAWVPSPTAAVLHAIHYHQVNLSDIQNNLMKTLTDKTREMLTLPIEPDPSWTEKEINEELENNAQGILGYVVRWIEHGIGCSKVPDIHGTGLMEDRATLRISSQHMANWLHHGVVTKEQVRQVMKKMAKLVDEQNQLDPDYQFMSGRFEESEAFQGALELIFEGHQQPNGYTEPILHRRRRAFKNK